MDYDIVISGGGIAGSALALALAGSDLRVALLEPKPLCEAAAFSQSLLDFDKRVSAITVKSQRFFAELGVWDSIVEHACAYRHMRVWDGEGTGHIGFDAVDVGVDALGFIVENRAIVSSLQSALAATSAVRVISDSLVDCERIDAGLHLHLADGEPLSARLVIGADGALSPLRAMMGVSTREWDYQQQAIVATVQTAKPHQHTAWQRFTRHGPVALLPLSSASDEHFCSLVWSQDDAAAAVSMTLDDVAFCQALTAATEGCLGEVVASSARLAFPLRQRHAVNYVQENLALVADAAHTFHPLAGQGINLGLEDVAALVGVLQQANSADDIGSEVLLKRYQRERKSDNLLMMTAMEGFKRLFGERALPLRWLRNTGMSAVDKMVPLKQQLMRRAMGIE